MLFCLITPPTLQPVDGKQCCTIPAIRSHPWYILGALLILWYVQNAILYYTLCFECSFISVISLRSEGRFDPAVRSEGRFAPTIIMEGRFLTSITSEGSYTSIRISEGCFPPQWFLRVFLPPIVFEGMFSSLDNFWGWLLHRWFPRTIFPIDDFWGPFSPSTISENRVPPQWFLRAVLLPHYELCCFFRRTLQKSFFTFLLSVRVTKNLGNQKSSRIFPDRFFA